MLLLKRTKKNLREKKTCNFDRNTIQQIKWRKGKKIFKKKD